MIADGRIAASVRLPAERELAPGRRLSPDGALDSYAGIIRAMLLAPSPLLVKPFLYGQTRDRGDLGGSLRPA